jgi:hypothetical protein
MTEMNACLRRASRYRSAIWTVDADAFAAGRRHPKLEGADVVLVHPVRFVVAALPIGELLLEPPPLLRRVVELAECIGDLEAADVHLEPLDRVRVIGALFGERRHLGREVVDEGGLDQRSFAQGFE